MGYEGFLVNRLSGFLPKVHFKGSKRTGNPEPGLSCYEDDPPKVDRPQQKIPGPVPMAEPADYDQEEPANDKNYPQGMKNEDGIGQQNVHGQFSGAGVAGLITRHFFYD